MRANGVSGFLDPIAGPGGDSLPVVENSDGSLTAENKTFAGPALRSAERACKAYLPPAGFAARLSAEQQRQALAFARCMRANGIPSFPDPPGSSPTQGGQQTIPVPDSPAFLKAQTVCLKTTGGPVQVR